ncbi:helix-turn-helix domain-containing protein [Ruegeria arenilitoris]|uniref:helix-turn-helix domain-containing protein n=1 Tax=Ruegeria arenilitoris TaxID=1173585 RepID=UPI00147E4417|nr:helix-turn-helix domain-containing protein [Ruegeria arenilitoris]
MTTILKDQRHEQAVTLSFCQIPVPEIARRLGVSVPTIYRWLATKEVKQRHADLVRAQMQGALPELIQNAVEQARNPRTGLMGKVKLIEALLKSSGVDEPPEDKGYRPTVSINLNVDGEKDPANFLYIDSDTTHVPEWDTEDPKVKRLQQENERLRASLQAANVEFDDDPEAV